MAMCKCHPDKTFCPDMICVDFQDDVPIFARRDSPEGMKAVVYQEAQEKKRAWEQIEAMARKINPTLPADLSRHCIRIVLSKNHQSVNASRLASVDMPLND